MPVESRGPASGVVLFLLVVTLLQVSPVHADCIEYGDYLGPGPVLDLSASIMDLTAAGDLALVATQETGLVVLDVSAPESPSILSSIDLGYTYDVATDGAYAYAAVGTYGLKIVDLSEPVHPVLAGSLTLLDGAHGGIAAAGSYVFVGSGTSLYVVDAMDPASPQVSGTVYVEANPTAVTVNGTQLYVTTNGDAAQLIIFDVSNPSSPQGVGSVVLSDWIGGVHVGEVAVAGGYAYAAGAYDSSAHLWIVDVSVPAEAHVVADVEVPRGSYAGEVAVAGARAYFAGGGGTCIVDVSDPASPRLLASGIGYAGHFALAGDCMYQWQSSRYLGVIHLGDPIEPVGAVGIPGYEPRGLTVAGSTAYVITDEDVHLVDLSDPASPHVVGHTGHTATDLAVSGPTAYIAVGAGGLQTWDVSNAASPSFLGVLESSVYSVAVVGTRAYALDSFGGVLRVVDVSNPRSPREISPVATEHRFYSMTLAGEYLYLSGDHYTKPTSGSPTFDVVDVSDPDTAMVVGSIDVPVELSSMVFAQTAIGNYLFARSSWGIMLVDVSNSNSPVMVDPADGYDFYRGIVSVAAVDSVLYLAESRYIRVLDISNPLSPRSLQGVSLEFACGQIRAAGGFVYFVGDGEYDIPVMALLAQCSPTPISTISELRAQPLDSGIALRWQSGIDPELVDVFVYRRTAGDAWSCLTAEPLAASGPEFEFIDGDAEWGVPYEYEIELRAGDGTRLRFGPVSCQLSAFPALSLDLRPRLTRGEVRVMLNLPHPTAVEISLHDLAGRRLALLEQGVLKAGRHDLDLDLRRVGGPRAPTGLYFVRLETPRGRTNQRLAFVR